jgi:hypothetical protein
MKTPIEKFQYLSGLSQLSWEDAQDAWFESNKLIPEIAEYVKSIEEERDEARENSNRFQMEACTLREALMKCAAQAGHPEAAEGCRLIIATVKKP